VAEETQETWIGYRSSLKALNFENWLSVIL